MATPGQLIEAVHRATGVAMATIVDLDRKLVKSGLRSKGGRGMNAARMTPLDAARLLIALLASPQSTAASEAVSRYAATRRKRTQAVGSARIVPLNAALSSLPADHSFVDALAAMVVAMPAGALRSSTRINISALTRTTHGCIQITRNGEGMTMEYVPTSSTTRLGRAKPTGSVTVPDKAVGDMEQSRRITERTLFAVADCLNMKELTG